MVHTLLLFILRSRNLIFDPFHLPLRDNSRPILDFYYVYIVSYKYFGS